MVRGLLSWWCICNWFFLVEALLWKWSGASDIKLGLVPSIESVETNLDGATGQMHRFLQRLASLSSCIGSGGSWLSLGRVVDSANPVG